GITGRVLDRDPGDSRGHGAAQVRGDLTRLDREPALEVAVHGHLDARGDLLKVCQRLVDGEVVVRATLGPREARAGGRERLEAQAREVAGAADVPRIRDD